MKTVEEKYGVPTFETCKKLAEYWKEETLFAYFEGYSKTLNLYLCEQSAKYSKLICYAPQIHELLEVIPTIIDYRSKEYFLKLTKDMIYFEEVDDNILINEINVENENLAEYLAQLYITLKEKELL